MWRFIIVWEFGTTKKSLRGGRSQGGAREIKLAGSGGLGARNFGAKVEKAKKKR